MTEKPHTDCFTLHCTIYIANLQLSYSLISTGQLSLYLHKRIESHLHSSYTRAGCTKCRPSCLYLCKVLFEQSVDPRLQSIGIQNIHTAITELHTHTYIHIIGGLWDTDQCVCVCRTLLTNSSLFSNLWIFSPLILHSSYISYRGKTTQ